MPIKTANQKEKERKKNNSDDQHKNPQRTEGKEENKQDKTTEDFSTPEKYAITEDTQKISEKDKK